MAKQEPYAALLSAPKTLPGACVPAAAPNLMQRNVAATHFTLSSNPEGPREKRGPCDCGFGGGVRF